MTLFWLLWVLALAAGLWLCAPAAWREGLVRLAQGPAPVLAVRAGRRGPRTRAPVRIVRGDPPGRGSRGWPGRARTLAPWSPVSVTRIDRLRLLIGDALASFTGG